MILLTIIKEVIRLHQQGEILWLLNVVWATS